MNQERFTQQSRRGREEHRGFGESSWSGGSEWDSGSGATEQWGHLGIFGAREEQTTFRGRGPKGYRRSDDRIREDVSDRLTDDDAIDASGISVQVREGEVKLTGTVDDRGQKRRAEDVVEHVTGVTQVVNLLRVSRQR